MFSHRWTVPWVHWPCETHPGAARHTEPRVLCMRQGRCPMAKKERVREALSGLPSREYLMERMALGWRPTSIEWEGDILPEGASGQLYEEEIPYGLRVAPDCDGLVENPEEKEV